MWQVQYLHRYERISKIVKIKVTKRIYTFYKQFALFYYITLFVNWLFSFVYADFATIQTLNIQRTDFPVLKITKYSTIYNRNCLSYYNQLSYTIILHINTNVIILKHTSVMRNPWHALVVSLWRLLSSNGSIVLGSHFFVLRI